MEPRHFLTLVHENASDDKTLPFGEDRAAAASRLQAMIQSGGPTGIVLGILFSTRKLIKIARLQSKAWHESQRSVALENDDAAIRVQKENTRLDLERRHLSLQEEAERLGIVLPGSSLVVISDELTPDSPLTPVDMGDLMHATTVVATPWQDLSVDERRQRLIEEAAILGIPLAQEAHQAKATGSQDTPASPDAPSPSPAAPDAANAPAATTGGQASAKKGQAQANAKKNAQDGAKATEGAADSDSASVGPGTSGDLLGG